MRISPVFQSQQSYAGMSSPAVYGSGTRVQTSQAEPQIIPRPYFGTTSAVPTKQPNGFHFSDYTTFFRKDLDWNKLVEGLTEQFDTTRIFCYGGSDGSEAYSLALHLIARLGEAEARRRFFPIISVDMDPNAFKNPKTHHVIVMKKKEVEQVARLLRRSEQTKLTAADVLTQLIPEDDTKERQRVSKLSRPVVPHEITTNPELRPLLNGRYRTPFYHYRLNEPLRSAVVFKKGKAQDIGEKTFTSNSSVVVLARNMWPYLSPDETATAAQALHQHMPDGSWLITGDFDQKYSEVDQYLSDAGFKASAEPMVIQHGWEQGTRYHYPSGVVRENGDIPTGGWFIK